MNDTNKTNNQRKGNNSAFAFLPSYLNIEDMNYILFDAPYEYFGGYSWYDLPPNQLQGIAYSSGLLAETLDTLFEEDCHRMTHKNIDDRDWSRLTLGERIRQIEAKESLGNCLPSVVGHLVKRSRSC